MFDKQLNSEDFYYSPEGYVIFTEKWYLFNVKRNEQDAFIIINRFFQSKENQLEDFI